MLLLSQSPTLLGAWAAWCLCHSLPATLRLKRRLSRLFNLSPQRYRLVYVLFSSFTLGPLLAWQSQVITRADPAALPWQIFRITFFAYSVGMFFAGGQSYNLKEFLGLATGTEANNSTPMPFRRNGILSWVRHPWYSGGIALLVALGKTPEELLDLRLLLAAYLLLCCLIEERRLVAELGGVYREYQQQVPMLLPRRRKIEN